MKYENGDDKRKESYSYMRMYSLCVTFLETRN